jgi:hypothetical protein
MSEVHASLLGLGVAAALIAVLEWRRWAKARREEERRRQSHATFNHAILDTFRAFEAAVGRSFARRPPEAVRTEHYIALSTAAFLTDTAARRQAARDLAASCQESGLDGCCVLTGPSDAQVVWSRVDDPVSGIALLVIQYGNAVFLKVGLA